MKLLEDYEKARESVFEYFGYKEDWCVFPLDDATDYHWTLNGGDDGDVCFADTLKELQQAEGNYYVNEIYTNRHLPKWVYRGKDYTMILVDTHVDGNKFLQIFKNSLEVPYE